ncbi:NlpC/P60 family N-terminal domain-containing protein [Fundidesulfovibrio butyratiphilus]
MVFPRRLRFVASCLALSFLLGACTFQQKRPEITFEPKVDWGVSKKPFDDLKVLKQDTSAYTDKLKSEITLLSRQAATVRSETYGKRFFNAWRCSSPSYAMSSARRSLSAYAKRPGYDVSGSPHSSGWVAGLAANANLRRANTNRPAILVANSNLRALPTREGRFGPPGTPGQGYPFDIFQVSALWLGMPVYVDHVSRDGAWALVETAIAPGWVPTSDLAYVDDAFMNDYMRRPFAAVIKENAAFDAGGHEVRLGVGAVLPVEDTDGVRLKLGIPTSGPGGMATLSPVWAMWDQAVLMPLLATPANVARLANQMMGQAYGWGGLDGKRDCSAMTRDLMAPFGVWLPRNSSAQAKSGAFVSLEGLSPQEKEQTILRVGVPFATLVWLPGHIMLYVGQYQGHPVVFHNMWGMRTLEANGREGRKVVGKAVVTTLRLGEIFPEVGPDRIILNRVRGISTVLTAPAEGEAGTGGAFCVDPGSGDQ